MGNVGSNRSGRRRHRSNRNPATQQPAPAPEVTGNRYVFAAATPYPSQYPNPNPPPYYHYPGYYAPPPPVPTPYPHHFRGGGIYPGPGPAHGNWVGPHYPCGAVPHPGVPYVDYQKAVTIRNDVNVKKETIRVEPDEENPGRFLVAFTFDATAPGR